MYKKFIVVLLAIVIFQNTVYAQNTRFNADSRDYEHMLDQLKKEERFNENCRDFKNKAYINEQGAKIYLSLNCKERKLLLYVDNQEINLSRVCQDERFNEQISLMPLKPFKEESYSSIRFLEYELALSYEINKEDTISSDYRSESLLDFEYNVTNKTFTLSNGLHKPFDLSNHDVNACRCRSSDKTLYSDGFAITQSSCCHSRGGSLSRVRCEYQTTFTEN